MLSATALTGLLSGLRFFIFIIDDDDRTLPFQRLGLKGLIGVIAIFFESRLKIGPCTDKLYAVLPAGVETKTPSETNLFIIVFFLFFRTFQYVFSVLLMVLKGFNVLVGFYVT